MILFGKAPDTYKIYNMIKEVMSSRIDELEEEINKIMDMIESMQKYSSPHAFIEYAEKYITKYGLPRLISKEVFENNKTVIIVEKTLTYKPLMTYEYPCIPVIAYYNTNDTLEVRIGTSTEYITQIIKPKGYYWVPLFRTKPIIYKPNTKININPPPEKIIILSIEPRGKTITSNIP